jgi:hypothetical protein
VPVALVVPELALRVPQVLPPPPGVKVNITRSPEFAGPVTVIVSVDVLVPLAEIVAAAGVMARAVGPAPVDVWVIVAEPLPPVLASMAVTVQNPIVVLDV